MAIETKYARIGNAFETEEKYLNSSVKPLKGEILGVSNKNGYSKIKIGDGIHEYKNLDFIDQEAIDLINNQTIHYLGLNPLSQYLESKNFKIDETNLYQYDTTENWINIGTGYGYIAAKDRNLIEDYPVISVNGTTEWNSFIINFVYQDGSQKVIYQILFPLITKGTIYHRTGNAKGWYANENRWVKEINAREVYPSLTTKQKNQLVDLMDQYQRVRNTLFFYTGAARRECYAFPEVTDKQGYGYSPAKACVLKHKNENINGNKEIDYYKYMLNCGVFCQMIWMGRPISDFLNKENEAENKLLSHAEGSTISNKTLALTSPPSKITTKINSVLTDETGKSWGYYFNFDLSKKAYGLKNGKNNFYSYNSYTKTANVKLVKIGTDENDNPIYGYESDNNDYTCILSQGNGVESKSNSQQIIIDGQFLIKPIVNIAENTKICLGQIANSNYKPEYIIPLNVYHSSINFTGYLDTEGKIYVINNNKEITKSNYVTINGSYFTNYQEKYPLGLDGASHMAEELYRMGCEIPREKMDVGDLVFYCAGDISDEDSELENRAFRNITHVGIVYSMTDGEPMIMDCTNAYEDPSVLGRTSLNSENNNFAVAKSAYQHNQTVMVARHPVAFGKGGNVPSEFTPYRGIG